MSSRITLLVASAICTALISGPANAQSKPKPKTKQAPGTIGTKQLAGTEGQINTTYSFQANSYYSYPRFNFTLIDAEYSIERLVTKNNYYAPKKDEKLLLLRYIIQNPNKEDISIGSYRFNQRFFQAVASDNKTYDGERTPHSMNATRVSGKPYTEEETVLKPGQKSEPILVGLIVPADASIPKLVVNSGRVGTNEKVVRFDLKGKIKPLPAPYTDTTGAVALETVPAKIGEKYIGTCSDFTVESVGYVNEAIGDVAPPEEGRLFSVLINAQLNGKNGSNIFNSDENFTVSLTDADGEKITTDTFLHATRPVPVESRRIEYGSTYKFRAVFSLPKGVSAQKVIVRNDSWFNGVEPGRDFVYDVPSAP